MNLIKHHRKLAITHLNKFVRNRMEIDKFVDDMKKI